MASITLNKKKTLIVSVIVVGILIIAGAVTYVVKSNYDKNTQQTVQQTPTAKKAAADTKKMDGVKASMSGDTDKAKQLLLEAQAEYKAMNDTDAVVDTDAQLYFIEHPSTPPAATTPTTDSASGTTNTNQTNN